MKKNRWLLLAIMLCFASTMKAQFYSSDRVYTYQYDYTDDDGIKYKDAEGRAVYRHYQWVYFQKDMMGVANVLRQSVLCQNLLNNPNYYQDEARNDLVSDYKAYNSGPGTAGKSVYMYKYCSEYSTSTKTTYRSATAESYNSYGSPWAHWGELSWRSTCYTFSNDKSELIIWNTNSPNKRYYYKRVEESDLCPKANMDFLY